MDDQDPTTNSQSRGDVLMPTAPLLLSSLQFSVWINPDGESERISTEEAARRVVSEPPILCHRMATAQRLGIDPFVCFDVLELVAFCRPVTSITPTPRGLAIFIGAPEPRSVEQAAMVIAQTAKIMLRELHARGPRLDPFAAEIARNMMADGWGWGPAVLHAMQESDIRRPDPSPSRGLKVWERLEEWQESPPPDPAGQESVSSNEARRKLAMLLDHGSEKRKQQSDYASAVSMAFAPRNHREEPNIILAEAGTGVGKTLGYIAPASLWAIKNGAPIWFSTYTRNLQTQIDNELDRLFPEPWKKKKKVVVRKGRENYLCLLNLEEATLALSARPQNAIALGLMSRWVSHSRDGDMIGGDFPGWLVELLGKSQTLELTDRRGECIYATCPHYHRCFIERNIRRARKADIVVANHALIMTQAAMGGGRDEGALPTHYVFDEGHHLFDAADSAFAARLSAVESQELRRWLVGAETGGRPVSRVSSRAQGLKKRLEEVIATDPKTGELVEAVVQAAAVLTRDGWGNRLIDGQARGPMESFLYCLREQVYARTNDHNSPYSLETETQPATPELCASAKELVAALTELAKPLEALKKHLEYRLDREASELESDIRNKLERNARSLEQRALLQVLGWIDMLKSLQMQTPEDFTDWLLIERSGGRDLDVGLHRHWVDPMRPFAATLLSQAHGIVVTSATLTDAALNDATLANDRKTKEQESLVQNIIPFPGAQKTGEETSPAMATKTMEGSKHGCTENSEGGEGNNTLCLGAEQRSGWLSAEQRSGTLHLPHRPLFAHFQSPYDYSKQTKVIIVKDVMKNNPQQVAAAYRELFLASRGGALGLFTAISRLKAVHKEISTPLDRGGLSLYSQHIDGMDISTLINIFRAEVDSCLLGTDAVRDGVDVPGESLRLIVFDRVPWPKPTILHKARKDRFGGKFYSDSQARLRIKQAYGRLIRRASDRGIFVLLDPGMPTRLTTAFPERVEIVKTGLADAIAQTREFLKPL